MRRRGMGWTFGALMAAVLVGTTAQGAEPLREGFGGGPVAAREGAGWTQEDPAFEIAEPSYVELPVSVQAAQGMISFDLQRKPDGPTGNRSVFELKDAKGETLFLFQVDWEPAENGGRPWFVLRRGDGYWRRGMGLWGAWIPMDERVEPGQWIQVDLTWDDRAREYGLYVDGRPQDASPKIYDWGAQSFIEDPRPGFEADLAAKGAGSWFTAEPFSSLLGEAVSVRVGIHTEPAEPGIGYSPLSNAVVDNFVLVIDEPMGELHTKDHDVRNLSAVFTAGGVELSWGPPAIHGVNQEFVVYRRGGAEGSARFEKLATVRGLTYTDTSAVAGKEYRYSVASVYGDLKGGTLEGKYPPEITVQAQDFAVASVATEKAVYGAGQEIVVTLRGTKDGKATFTVEGVTGEPVAMEEVDDGVYVGKVAVPGDVNLAASAVTGKLTDPSDGKTVTKSSGTVTIDTTAPEAVPAGRIVVSAPAPGEIELAWVAGPSGDVVEYGILRGEGAAPDSVGALYERVKGLRFVDTGAVPGLTYYYAVVPLDAAGNRGAPSDVVTAEAAPGEGPAIAAVSVEPYGRPVKPGETVAVTLTGQSGATATVDVGQLVPALALTEEGRTGRYVGRYTVTDADVTGTKAAYPLTAHLVDAYGGSHLAGPELAIVGRDALNDKTPPVIAGAEHDGWRIAGFSGDLVAGDVLTVTLTGEPAGYASFDIQGVASGVPMAEGAPGVYIGSYTVGWGDEGTDVPLHAHLADEAGNESTAPVGRTVSFDTRVRLTVTAKDTLLPADRKSQTRLVARATNANGDEVAGHELALTLSTTEEYTGVVGGGRIEDREARMEDEDDVEVKWGGVTDAFGEVAASYTAGFAAKTALVVAKDLTTGDVGTGWLNTYVAATVAIELTPRALRGATDRAILRLTAEPEKLTADGRSRSRLRAWLTDLAGTPLAGERIAFSLGGENGRLRTLSSVTNAQGLAEAEYRAGTAIGTVVVTASAAEWGVTASVQITLMSDAPAKIDLVASAAKLPADGRSEATLSVTVTDIHGNPNQEVPVTFAVLEGTGAFASPELLTNRNGEGQVSYIAGTRPGIAVIEARHTSRAPTEEELRRVQGTLFVPRLFDRQERDRIQLEEWLVEPGDEVVKGQPLAVLASRKGTWTLPAQEKGVFTRRVRFERDRLELGDTLGYVEIDPDVWANEYVQ